MPLLLFFFIVFVVVVVVIYLWVFDVVGECGGTRPLHIRLVAARIGVLRLK